MWGWLPDVKAVLPSLLGQALSSSQNFQLGSLTRGNSVEAIIKAFERTGMIRTLAEPNLTAISGESAEFLAGGEVPYITGIDTQSGTSSVAFKKFGVPTQNTDNYSAFLGFVKMRAERMPRS